MRWQQEQEQPQQQQQFNQATATTTATATATVRRLAHRSPASAHAETHPHVTGTPLRLSRERIADFASTEDYVWPDWLVGWLVGSVGRSVIRGLFGWIVWLVCSLVLSLVARWEVSAKQLATTGCTTATQPSLRSCVCFAKNTAVTSEGMVGTYSKLWLM